MDCLVLSNIACVACNRSGFADFAQAHQHFLERAHAKRFRKRSEDLKPESHMVYCPDVRGISEGPILAYLSTLGPLASVYFGYRMTPNLSQKQFAFFFVEFKSELDAKATLTVKKHLIEDRHIIVFKKNQDPKPNQNKSENIIIPEMLSKMAAINNPNDQVLLVTQIAELGPELTKGRAEVIETLEKVLKAVALKLEVLAFGSSKSGISLKGGDLDCYIDFDLTDDILKNAGISLQDLQDSISFKNKRLEVEKGKAIPIELEGNLPNILDAKSPNSRELVLMKLSFISRVLHRNRHLFANIKRIFEAQTPIIKFVHVSTGIQCDINCSNRMAYLNTQFIETILGWDPKLRPLLIFLKVWSKESKLIGPRSPRSLTSYALVILVLVYLQREKYLPKVTEFNEACNQHEVVEEWDFGFTRDLSQIKPTPKSIQFVPVLMGFFEFLSTFDYERDFICSRTAEVHPKSELKPNQVVPEPESANQFILFDPFEQTRNICKNVKGPGLAHFKRVCEQAKKYLQARDCLKLDGFFTLENCDYCTKPSADLKQARAISVSMRFSDVNNLTSMIQDGECDSKQTGHYMSKLILRILKDCLLLKSEGFDSESRNPGNRLRAALFVPPDAPTDFELHIQISIDRSDQDEGDIKKSKVEPQPLTSCRLRGFFNTWKGRLQPSLKNARAKGVNLLEFEVQKVNDKFQNQTQPNDPVVEFDFISDLIDQQICIRCVPVSEVNTDLQDLFAFLKDYLYAVCVGILFCEKDVVKSLVE
ncbi:speckle targeted PIP5K1A-regulated poly(A) polymerase-like [Tigriopus californicus]|uniref:speckle targeted PIP5K1A-regulated poly(A) polymerase-like n=1 Tax=Tigriopus californicus TaxID=6832 RepID=UPI0027DA352F|nr:speckle targeted PIP5K1A-regulated poly(A) polymerase-like [Tigriopus californicus]XP_059094949.1 speckle targeted PIP5K1A-regulated poly(A) polymerase-like [Tigriopus californicus]